MKKHLCSGGDEESDATRVDPLERFNQAVRSLLRQQTVSRSGRILPYSLVVAAFSMRSYGMGPFGSFYGLDDRLDWFFRDNYPFPEYNSPVYEATDLINCHSHMTYEMVSKHFPDKTNFIPHALPDSLFYPLKSHNLVVF